MAARASEADWIYSRGGWVWWRFGERLVAVGIPCGGVPSCGRLGVAVGAGSVAVSVGSAAVGAGSFTPIFVCINEVAGFFVGH